MANMLTPFEQAPKHQVKQFDVTCSLSLIGNTLGQVFSQLLLELGCACWSVGIAHSVEIRLVQLGTAMACVTPGRSMMMGVALQLGLTAEVKVF